MEEDKNTFSESDKLNYEIIGAAMKVHDTLGPGLLESVYEICLCQELTIRNIPFVRQVPFPIVYEGVNIGKVFIADLIVANQVLVELKSVRKLIDIHTAQTRTYLKLSGCQIGLIINFDTPRLKEGGLVKVKLQNSSSSS
jgi:GxxExxY protein